MVLSLSRYGCYHTVRISDTVLKVFIDLPPLTSYDLRSALRGPGNQFLRHIMDKTGSRLDLASDLSHIHVEVIPDSRRAHRTIDFLESLLTEVVRSYTEHRRKVLVAKQSRQERLEEEARIRRKRQQEARRKGYYRKDDPNGWVMYADDRARVDKSKRPKERSRSRSRSHSSDKAARKRRRRSRSRSRSNPVVRYLGNVKLRQRFTEEPLLNEMDPARIKAHQMVKELAVIAPLINSIRYRGEVNSSSINNSSRKRRKQLQSMMTRLADLQAIGLLPAGAEQVGAENETPAKSSSLSSPRRNSRRWSPPSKRSSRKRFSPSESSNKRSTRRSYHDRTPSRSPPGSRKSRRSKSRSPSISGEELPQQPSPSKKKRRRWSTSSPTKNRALSPSPPNPKNHHSKKKKKVFEPRQVINLTEEDSDREQSLSPGMLALPVEKHPSAVLVGYSDSD